jgi:hypothetical protein
MMSTFTATPIGVGTATFVPTVTPNMSSSLVPTTVINPNLLTATAIVELFTESAVQRTATAEARPEGVQIVEVNTPGNLQTEYVSIVNYTEDTVDLSGWTLSDSDGNVFTFPEDRQLSPNSVVAVYTHSGRDSGVILYWGLESAVYDSGETLILQDDTGTIESSYQVTIAQATVIPTIPPIGVQIMEVSGAGDLQSEVLTIQNFETTVNLSGWTLSDSDSNVFIFPEGRRVFSGASAMLYSRNGESTPIILYWGLDIAIYDSGETLILRDNMGAVMSIYQIP